MPKGLNLFSIRKIQIFFVFLCMWIQSFLFSHTEFSNPGDPFNPPALYLTWQHDPTSTMTIQWLAKKGQAPLQVFYTDLEKEHLSSVNSSHQPLPDTDYIVHFAELTNLQENTEYLFGFSEDSIQYKFKTMPAFLDRPLSFVVGGDCYHTLETLKQTNTQAAKTNPAFVIIGGDIAYSVSKFVPDGSESMQRWFDWLEAWKEHMQASDGRLIPLLAVIGNHETIGKYEQNPEQAKGFYNLFSMPGPQGYAALDFGRYMSLFLLDSGHTHPVEGAQSLWLNNELGRRRDVLHKFAIYHVPAYPSVRKFTNSKIVNVRNHWPPIFELHGLSAAFEHHDHAYKRSERIREGHVDPNGVLYLGDGAWGVPPRIPRKAQDTWYLKKTAARNHFIRVELSSENRRFQAIDIEGNIFDDFTVGRDQQIIEHLDQ